VKWRRKPKQTVLAKKDNFACLPRVYSELLRKMYPSYNVVVVVFEDKAGRYLTEEVPKSTANELR
jgi:hypothetical protein